MTSKHDFDFNVGERIRRIRSFYGIEAYELSERVGISRGFLSGIENGKTGISLFTASRIAKALKVKTSHIAGEEKLSLYINEGAYNAERD